MRSYFFRCAGYLLLWVGEAFLLVALILSLPVLFLSACGEWLQHGAYWLWSRQDFSGPSPRGWRWSGFWR